uniref:FTH domain-containing protein n=1 Tax=Rhabditophanes sp. KR3021 TaxID=114890 RepID=A0AC35U3Q9_9BILA
MLTMLTVVNKPLNLALSQQHIMKDCVSDLSTMATLSKTCVKFYNSNANVQIYKRERTIPYIHKQGPHTSIYFNSDRMNGTFYNISFTDQKELRNIINHFPPECFDQIYVFEFEVLCKNYDDKKVEINRLYFNDLMKKFFEKAFNLKKIILFCETRRLSTETFTFNIASIISSLASKSVNQIEIQCNNLLMIQNTFLSAKSEEEKIKQNFPKLEHIILHIKEGRFKENERVEFDNLLNTIQRSDFHLFELNLISFSTQFFEMTQTFGEVFKNMKKEMLYKTIVYPDKRNLNAYDSPLYEENAIAKDIKLRLGYFINYLGETESNTFSRYIQKLHLVYGPGDIRNLVIRPNMFANLNYLTSLKHFSIKFFMEEVADPHIRSTECIHSLPKDTLITLQINAPLNDLESNPLYNLYPHLKELKLNYSSTVERLNILDNAYFAKFQNLVILHLTCIMKREFTFPNSLRLLILECHSQEGKHEKLEITGELRFKLDVNKMEKEERIYQCNAFFDDTICNCHKPKRNLQNLVIKRDFWTNIISHVHFDQIQSWDTYTKLIQRKTQEFNSYEIGDEED